MRAIGRVIRYRGKRVKIVEEDTGYTDGRNVYWARALEPVAGYDTGDELTVSARTVRARLQG